MHTFLLFLPYSQEIIQKKKNMFYTLKAFCYYVWGKYTDPWHSQEVPENFEYSRFADLFTFRFNWANFGFIYFKAKL